MKLQLLLNVLNNWGFSYKFSLGLRNYRIINLKKNFLIDILEDMNILKNVKNITILSTKKPLLKSNNKGFLFFKRNNFFYSVITVSLISTTSTSKIRS